MNNVMSLEAVQTELIRDILNINDVLVLPTMCFSSHNNDKGRYPASNATRITLGLSAIKTPREGSSRLRN